MNFRRLVAAIGKMPEGRDQRHEGRDPDHSRTIAVVRPGDHAADKGVAEQRQADGRSQQRQIVEPAAPHGGGTDGDNEQHRDKRDRNVDPG